jgi:hypothetical protein
MCGLLRDLLTLAQSIECLPSLAELIEGASSNLYFDAASHTPISAVQWANNVRVSTTNFLCKHEK